MGKILDVFDLTYRDFDKINISFDSNTFYSIIGPNNCGKTTLFKLIAGIIPSNDMIYYQDICFDSHNRRDYVINFGIVDQVNQDSFIFKSVIDEMMYPLHNLGFSKKKSLERIKEVLDIFQVSYFLDKDINELNYYEKELLLIIISLLHKPKVLLLDGVLEIFPKDMQANIVKVIHRIVHNGMLVINFSSSLDSAYYSDQIILMDNYKIIGIYDKHDIYNDDKLFYEHNLEIPFMIDLSVKLRMYNIINKEYSNMKAMVDDIWP